MTQTITGLNPKAAEFLATFAAQGRLVFTTAQARAFWGATTYATNVLGRLEKGGCFPRAAATSVNPAIVTITTSGRLLLGTRVDLEHRAQRWAEVHRREPKVEVKQLGLWENEK